MNLITFNSLMEYYRIILYVIFGVLPSLIWLFYYLKKDLHPEPKRMILKIFIYGSLITVLAFFIQIGLSELLKQLQDVTFFASYPVAIEAIKWFLVIALTEELLKYAIVKINVSGSYVLDEPLDIMLYMVIVALGFTAVENILYLFSPIDNISFDVIIKTTLMLSFIRFIGATFLHTLCSATLGYFMAISFLETEKKVILTLIGICIAIFFHGLYDFSIMTLKAPLNFVIPVMIIIGLAIFVISAFNKTRRMKSISNI